MISKIFAAMSIAVLALVIGVIFYEEIGASKVNVKVQIKKGDDAFKVMKQVVPTDSSLLSVTELNKTENEYILTVRTHRNKPKLLDWMRRNSRLEKAEEFPD